MIENDDQKDMIHELQRRTGLPYLECKKALIKCKWDKVLAYRLLTDDNPLRWRI